MAIGDDPRDDLHEPAKGCDNRSWPDRSVVNATLQTHDMET